MKMRSELQNQEVYAAAVTVTATMNELVMDMARAPTADEPSQPTMACYGVILPLASS